MKLLAAILLAVGLAGCTAPVDCEYDARPTAEAGRPVADAPATRTKGTERLRPVGPPGGPDLEERLRQLQRDGVYSQRTVDDILLARTQLLKQMHRIPPDFCGWAASTIEGKLYTTTGGPWRTMDWLAQNNPPGRVGFSTGVNAAR